MSSLYNRNYYPSPRQTGFTPPRTGGARVLPLLFFFAGILLLFFGLSSLGAGVLLRPAPLPDGFAWKPPLELIKNSDLTPATVLLPLTGMPVTDTINATLDAGNWENAYALLAYDTSVTDPARIGALLQLGSRYAATKDKDKSTWCYVNAARIATLSPLLSDAVREDTYLQAASGLRTAGALDAARLVTDQAYLVAEYSPALRRDPQARRLTQVANAYSALGVESLADQARAAANEQAAATDPAGYLPREPFVISTGALPASPEVSSVTQVRIAAAKLLSGDIQAVAANRASDWPADSVNQLRDALVKEDQVRLAYYDRQFVSNQDPAVRTALLRDKVNWLGYKYRTARGAFGANLVPDWSKDSSTIGEAWSDAWGDLFKLYEAQAASIPNAQAVSQASEDVVRQEELAVRWGWYRGATEQDLHSTLSSLTEQLSAAQVPSLRVDLLDSGGKTLDILLPDELYGMGNKALPK